MLKYITILTLIIISMAGVLSVQASKSTELFIPIGQSPGLSGEFTVIGTIDQVDSQNQIILVQNSFDDYTVTIAESTKFYLDRSKAQLTNVRGTFADCGAGDTVEVKFMDNDLSQPAEWIKIEWTP
jgi:hypothetical protein